MLSSMAVFSMTEGRGRPRLTIRKIERGNSSLRAESLLQVHRALDLLDGVPRSTDPFEHSVGRLRAHRINRRRA
jgi:hypothetical protein